MTTCIYTLNRKDETIYSPDGRFYCYLSSWIVSPAYKAGAVLQTTTGEKVIFG